MTTTSYTVHTEGPCEAQVQNKISTNLLQFTSNSKYRQSSHRHSRMVQNFTKCPGLWQELRRGSSWVMVQCSTYNICIYTSCTPLPWQRTVSVGVINPMQGEQYQQEAVAFDYNTALCTNRNNNTRFVLLPYDKGVQNSYNPLLGFPQCTQQ